MKSPSRQSPPSPNRRDLAVRWPDHGTLLDAWERGLTEAPQQKLLTLLSAFLPDRAPEAIAEIPVGRRDAILLDIFEGLFGRHLAAVTSCPDCGAELEAEIAIADIRVGAPKEGATIKTLSAAGHRVSYRLVTTGDLLAIPESATPADARRILLGRCVSQAHNEQGSIVDSAALPEPVASALSARMAKLDPQANVSLSMACPACGNVFAELLDVAHFVLRHLNAWAIRLLRDIHGLASAYGWNEGETMSLSPVRRQLYLEMTGR